MVCLLDYATSSRQSLSAEHELPLPCCSLLRKPWLIAVFVAIVAAIAAGLTLLWCMCCRKPKKTTTPVETIEMGTVYGGTTVIGTVSPHHSTLTQIYSPGSKGSPGESALSPSAADPASRIPTVSRL